MSDIDEFKVNNANERRLCYAAAILGSLLANRNRNESEVHDWLIERSIKAADKLINKVYES